MNEREANERTMQEEARATAAPERGSRPPRRTSAQVELDTRFDLIVEALKLMPPDRLVELAARLSSEAPMTGKILCDEFEGFEAGKDKRPQPG